ncbi:MAG: hypothetical protein WAW51_06685, partial [Ilumatobacteraceae bacterium]
MNAPSRRKPGRLLAALVISAGLIGVACGSDDTGSKTTDATSPASETTGPGTEETTPVVETTAAPPTTAAGEVPVPGGKVVMAIEADTSSPWRPSEMVCAIACYQVIRNIYDSLAMPNGAGSWSPYLASAITPND